MLSVCCLSVLSVLSCLSVSDVRALWPNGWADQDKTWHEGRPRHWPHCLRWGPSSPSPKGHSPQFSAHVCCGQMAAWIKISLGMQLGLGPGDFVLNADPTPGSPPQKGGAPKFSAHVYCGQTAGWMKLVLGMEVGLSPGYFVLDEDPTPLPKGEGAAPQIFGPCLLRPNGWMGEAGTWHGGRPQPRRLCVRWGPSPLPPKGLSLIHI